MKMTVLYIKDTGHVMAALTRTALVEAAPEEPNAVPPSAEVVSLVGDALPVSDFFDVTNPPLPVRDAETFSIPADRLSSLTVERNDAVLFSPHRYCVVDGKTLQLSTNAPLPGLSPSNNGQDLLVTLGAATPVKLSLQLYVVPATGPASDGRALQGVFDPATGTATSIAFGVGSALASSFKALVLLPGCRSAIVHHP